MTGGPPPIVCIVGGKNAGKTELTVTLGAELNRRGYRVMTAKHAHGFHLDQPGRDSWRHRHEGGAHRTVLASPSDFAVIGGWPQEEMSLAELVDRFLSDADIVLAEGFKTSPEPKVEVFRSREGEGPVFSRAERAPSGVIALVTDDPEVDTTLPVFDLFDQESLEGLADLLEERILLGGGRT